MSAFTEESVFTALKDYHNVEYDWSHLSSTVFGDLRKAAVLVPLFVKDGEVFVWLTKRSKALKNDSGMVALPGGMKDPEDKNEWVTCLRESDEEIGLKSTQVKFVCQLLPRVNKRLILITPVVGIVDPKYSPVINEHEVESSFYLPLRRFISSAGHYSHDFTLREVTSAVHYFKDTVNGQTYTTWGLTASIIIEIAISLYKKEPDFVWKYHSDQVSMGDPFNTQRKYLELFENHLRMKASSKL